MKNEIHNVSLAFINETIIACACTCKAGSFGAEKIVCVHILPVLLQVTHFLFKYMAESILIELANAWKNINETTIDLTKLRGMKKAIEALIIADDVRNMKTNNNRTTISELLHPYDVGTERAKLRLTRTDISNKLGPLRYVNFSSAIQRAKEALKKKK